MQTYKDCQCLLFVRGDGLPIPEYLLEDHTVERYVRAPSLEETREGSSGPNA